MMGFPFLAQAGPITFNSALPVADGMTILRSQLKLLRKSTDATAAGRLLHVTAAPMVPVYGASPKLALFGMCQTASKIYPRQRRKLTP